MPAPSQEGERMKVEQVPLGTLKPYDGNAKKHTEEQLEAVKNSIKEFGFRNPVIAWHDQDGRAEIVAGHARCKAAQELGMDEVPVVFCDDLTDAQRRALTLVDNQTTIMTGWDEDALAYELDVLSGDFDMSDFGFDLGAVEDFAVPDDSPLEDGGRHRGREVRGRGRLPRGHRRDNRGRAGQRRRGVDSMTDGA